MKNILILLSFLIPFNAFLQGSYSSNKKVLLRGKAIWTGILEDAYFRNLSIGAEFRVLNQHSIGVDFVHTRFRNQFDSLVDGLDSGTGPSVYSRRNYINVDYRFYPWKKRLNDQFDPYFNAFAKFGQRDVWSEAPGYFYANRYESLSGHNSDFIDYGLASGFRLDFGSNDRVGLDFNMGCVRRISQIHYQRIHHTISPTPGPGAIEEYNVIRARWMIHARLNLCVRLFRF